MDERREVKLMFSEKEMTLFANMSRDYNPMHMDELYARKSAYGQRIVFGILSTLACLKLVDRDKISNISEIQVDFDNPVFLGKEYTAVVEEETSTDVYLCLYSDSIKNLSIRILTNERRSSDDKYFSIGTYDTECRIKPREYKDEDYLLDNNVKKGYSIEVNSMKEFLKSVGALDIEANKDLVKILCLCSYIIGMEIPGKRAMFSKLRLEFCGKILHNSNSIYYLAQQKRYDSNFRMIDLDINVGAADNLIARGTLKSFIQKDITVPSIDTISQKLTKGSSMKGKVALVVGGSRGLGATLVKALVLKGCNVILNYYKSTDEAILLQEEMKMVYPKSLHLFQGDISKPESCVALKKYIIDNFNGLDILILNAFLPALSDTNKESYISKNFSLYKEPIAAFAELLNKQKSAIVGISSAYVEKGPKELEHYISAKRMMEEYLQSKANEYKMCSFIVARPPKMLTDMNNTPSGWINAVSPEIVAVKIVSAIESRLVSDEVENNLCFIDDFNDSKYIQVTSTFTANHLQTSLDFWSKEMQWPMKVKFSQYNQVLQDLLNPKSDLHLNLNGLNVILIRLSDWYRFKGKVNDTEYSCDDSVKEFYHSYTDEMIEALRFYSSYYNGQTIFLICPSDPMYIKDTLWKELYNTVETKLIDEVKRLAGIEVVKAEDYHNLYEVENIFDPTSDILGHIPFIRDYFGFLGTLISRTYFSMIKKKYKVIVLDCDNTLWKGIVAEQGSYGIEITDTFQRWQNKLIELSNQGYLLCLCSKNNLEDVLDVFRNNSAMKLKLDHIVDYCINWKSKSENLYDLANSLNVGIDSFIFIDDSPLECEEVRRNCPQVLTFRWPEDEQNAEQFINHNWSIDHLGTVTKEDSQRKLFYKANVDREQLKLSSRSYADFLANLNLSVRIEPLKENLIERASQLTNRTNQFNLTTIRRRNNEILSIFKDDSYVITSVEVDDKFGSYGFVGLMIAKTHKDSLVVDSFILSCRVLGRGVEYKMLQQLGKIAQELKLCKIVLLFNKNAKNEVAGRFIEELRKDLTDLEYVEIKQDSFECRMDSSSIADYQFTQDRQEQEVIQNNVPVALEENNSMVMREVEKKLEKISLELNSQSKIRNLLDIGFVAKNISHKEKGKSIEDSIRDVFCRCSALKRNEIDFNMPIENFNLESMTKVEISSELVRIYPRLSLTFLFEYPNLKSLVLFLKQYYLNDAVEELYEVKNETEEVRKCTDEANDDIAIIGINAYLPQASTIQEFWKNLVAGNSCITEVPGNRWDVEDFFSEDSKETGKSHCKWGGFLDNVEEFDNSFFNISRKEAEAMDPQQRLLLQVVWGLIEDAGYRAEHMDSRTGVFVGAISSDFGLYLNQSAKLGYSAYRWGDYYQIANRVSYFFNFKGPSMVIDTACSSSGTALYVACQSILTKECKTAIVGGVNLILHPSRYIQYTKMGLLTSEDKCRPFSGDAKGTIMGEGIGAILIKSKKQAQIDGDHIYGVIKACSINSGGKTNGFTVPNPNAHTSLILDTLKKANIDGSTVNYIEAHGTGTIVGDPIEVKGITDALSSANELGNYEGQCTIGTVKSNIGHLESAATIAGIIKILLQMKYHKLVPSINASPINKLIDFKSANLSVQQELTDWKCIKQKGKDGTIELPRRAGISSFGAGGSNFHAILEEYQEADSYSTNFSGKSLVILSAKSEKVLRIMVKNLKEYIAYEYKHQGIADKRVFVQRLAYTLQVGRSAFSHRLALTIDSLDDLCEKLDQYLLSGANDEEIQYGICENSDIKIQWKGEKEGEYFKYLYSSGQLKKLGYLWLVGIDIYWEDIYDAKKPKRISLPVYPFDKKVFPLKKLISFNNNVKMYKKVFIPFEKYSIYKLTTSLSQFPFLIDHQVNNTIIVPGAFSLSLMLTCLMDEHKFQRFRLSDITFRKALLLERKSQHLTQVIFDLNDNNTVEVYVDKAQSEEADKDWFLYTKARFEGEIENDSRYFNILPMQSQYSKIIGKEEFYALGLEKGFKWGPQFQCIQQVWLNEDNVLARISFKYSLKEQSVFPASVLDACLQPYIFALIKHCKALGVDDTYIPFSIEELKMYRKTPEDIYTYIDFKKAEELHQEYFTVNCKILDLNGEVVCEINGLRLKQVENNLFSKIEDKAVKSLYKPYWSILNESDKLTENEYEPSLIFDISYSHSPFAVIKNTLSQRYNATECHAQGNSISFENAGELLNGSSGVRSLIVFYDGLQDNTIIDSSSYDVCYERIILPWFRFVKEIAANYSQYQLRIILVTQNSQNVLATETSSSVANALIGIAKVLGSENSNIYIKAFDISKEDLYKASMDLEYLHNCCKKLLSYGNGYDESMFEELAIRNNVVLKKSLVNLESMKNENVVSLLKPEGTYLIIGGAGGLGFELSSYLINRWKANVIWIGRKPQSQVMSKIEKLQAMGGRVFYIEADATHYDELEECYGSISATLPKINGVFHAAIILKDAILANMKESDFSEVFHTKSKTMMNVMKLLENEKLDFIASFSSECSFRGSPAQANYVAACRFLDSYLLSLSSLKNIPVRIINWGYWGEVGIVATSDYRKRLEAQGLLPFDNAEGIKIIEKVMEGNQQQLLAVKKTRAYDMKVGINNDYVLQVRDNKSDSFKNDLVAEINKFNLQYEKEDVISYYEEFNHVLNYVPAITNNLLNQIAKLPENEVKPQFERYVKAIEAIKAGTKNNSAVDLSRRSKMSKAASTWLKFLDIVNDYGIAVITDKIKFSDVFFANGSNEVVEGIYKFNPLSAYFNKIMALTIRKRVERLVKNSDGSKKVRILEFGGGTGSTTAYVLEELKEFSDNVEYVFTDVSIHFLSIVKEQFNSQYDFVTYKLFNLNSDITQQNITPGSFDIILGTNAIHICSNMSNVLVNLKRALVPSGVLLINELTASHDALTLSFGLFTGWWDYEDEYIRIKNSPLISSDQWKNLLEIHGFTNVAAVDFPNRFNGNISLQHMIFCQSDGESLKTAIKTPIKTQVMVKQKQETALPKIRSIEEPLCKNDIDTKDMLKTLASMPNNRRNKYVEDVLKAELRSILLMDDDESISSTVGFKDIGIDSLLAIHFRDALSKMIKQKLSSTIVYDYPNIQSLAAYILEIICVDKTISDHTTDKIDLSILDKKDKEDDDSLIHEINSMSEDEAASELIKELENL